ncbi:hypothetical protein MUN89_15420 [Halobacillus salinarum]|uniref:Uncharacterized protein n=1 Tax=Halobacillus salinarum TaxID=2932257 RepID=A0ABY4EFQ2_9BACI|nr:hypothetical protein [Halobacillus salinarum]UOQ43300.1 hypothetical protein MUN89_15420 [Halobacillus salinarum]
MVSACFWKCISPDAWLQTVGGLSGAFLGTLLAGLVSLFLYKRELKEQKIEKFSGFKRNYIVYFRSNLCHLLQLMEDRGMETEGNELPVYVLQIVKEKNNEIKRFYLRELEPETPILLYKNFELIYEQLINITNACQLLLLQKEQEEVPAVFNVKEILRESLTVIRETLEEIDKEVQEELE